MTPKQVIALAQAKDAKFLNVRFSDIHATVHNFTTPISELTESLFEEGLGFDGSSIRGWQSIEQSDMLVVPDPTTAFMDPFTKLDTLVMYCNVKDPISGEGYALSPRGVAQRAEAYLKESGIGDTAYIGPEAEFFVFDDVRYSCTSNECFAAVDSEEGIWNTAAGQLPNQGYKIRHKEGYLPLPPSDKHFDLRSEMVRVMQEVGMDVECHHHEVATAGQCEIDLRFAPLLQMADTMQTYKYIVKNVAYKAGKTATFMPKPIAGDNGSGMHTHSSIWKGGKPLFAGSGYAGLSDEAKWYTGGILKHARALCALTNPTQNSYKRLVPGFEAPVMLAYSMRNRSAICRIPMYSNSPKAKRVEFRAPDPAANPYLAFAAIVMAGLDGIENKTDPGEAMDANLYDLTQAQQAEMKLKTVPASLKEAIDALKADHDFLLKGGVFTKELIESFIALKQEEYDAVRITPHPKEFELYYDC